MKPKLKICGMKVPANLLEVAALQPDYMGFIFFPASKRFVADLLPFALESLPPAIKRTGVFVNEDIAILKDRIEAFGLDAVQLHGSESPDYCAALKTSGVEVIKAFGIDDGFDFNLTELYENVADYFLFDTQTPGHGGSGKTFDWTLLEDYKLNKPYFLSGGIDLESIAAIKRIEDPRFYAVDVNSKFEISPGLKDIHKLIDFKNRMMTS